MIAWSADALEMHKANKCFVATIGKFQLIKMPETWSQLKILSTNLKNCAFIKMTATRHHMTKEIHKVWVYIIIVQELHAHNFNLWIQLWGDVFHKIAVQDKLSKLMEDAKDVHHFNPLIKVVNAEMCAQLIQDKLCFKTVDVKVVHSTQNHNMITSLDNIPDVVRITVVLTTSCSWLVTARLAHIPAHRMHLEEDVKPWE